MLTALNLSVSQLQLSTSIVAVILQLTFIVINWLINRHSPHRGVLVSKDEHSYTYLFILLVFDGLGFYLQSAFAYVLMSLVSPITYSVANCVKRALLITLSIYHFGDVVTLMNWSGMFMVLVGVYVFNTVSRMEQSKGIVLDTTCIDKNHGIETRTIATLSEIVIDVRKEG